MKGEAHPIMTTHLPVLRRATPPCVEAVALVAQNSRRQLAGLGDLARRRARSDVGTHARHKHDVVRAGVDGDDVDL